MLLLEAKPEFSGRKDKSQRGFTLLELLVVLVIIAIISSTSIGALRFFGEKSIEEFPKNFKSLFLLANEEAILTGKVHGLFRSEKQLVLRKFSRPEQKKSDKAKASKEGVGIVLSGLAALTKGSDDEPESAQEPASAASIDRGAFPEDSGGSWVDLDIEPLAIPDGLTLKLATDYPVPFKDFEPEEKTKKEGAKRQSEKETKLQENKDKKKAKPKKEELITTFWPNGLIQPGGTATIASLEEEKKVSVRWLTTAEINVTDNKQ